MIFKALIQGFLTCWRGLTWWVVWWEPKPKRLLDQRITTDVVRMRGDITGIPTELAYQQEKRLPLQVERFQRDMEDAALRKLEHDIIYNISPTERPLPNYPGGFAPNAQFNAVDPMRDALLSARAQANMANQSWSQQQALGLGSAVGAGAAAFAAFCGGQ